MKDLSMNRRSFLKVAGTAGLALVAKDVLGATTFLKPVSVGNPLASYPDRDWERVYRNMFKPDSDFVFLCVPNDTHNCLLKAYVKNGMVVRIGPSYGFGKTADHFAIRHPIDGIRGAAIRDLYYIEDFIQTGALKVR